MTDHTPSTNTLRIGMRFERRDAPKLQRIADDLIRNEISGDAVTMFSGAAQAATIGEPLVVVCTNLTEAKRMVAVYVRKGIAPPTLHSLS